MLLVTAVIFLGHTGTPETTLLKKTTASSVAQAQQALAEEALAEQAPAPEPSVTSEPKPVAPPSAKAFESKKLTSRTVGGVTYLLPKTWGKIDQPDKGSLAVRISGQFILNLTDMGPGKIDTQMINTISTSIGESKKTNVSATPTVDTAGVGRMTVTADGQKVTVWLIPVDNRILLLTSVGLSKTDIQTIESVVKANQ